MGQVNYTELAPSKRVRQAIWAGIKEGDTAQVYDRGQGRFKDIDVSVDGVWGANAAVQAYGRLQPGAGDFFQLRDLWGNPINLVSGDQFTRIWENPVEIKWVLTGGDGTTDLTVTLNLIA